MLSLFCLHLLVSSKKKYYSALGPNNTFSSAQQAWKNKDSQQFCPFSKILRIIAKLAILFLFTFPISLTLLLIYQNQRLNLHFFFVKASSAYTTSLWLSPGSLIIPRNNTLRKKIWLYCCWGGQLKSFALLYIQLKKREETVLAKCGTLFEQNRRKLCGSY